MLRAADRSNDLKTELSEMTLFSGNQLLRQIFDWVHLGQCCLVTPSLSLLPNPTDRLFGSVVLPATEDIVAIWKTSEGLRFQNYKAVFTILDEAVIPRGWVHAL